MASPDRSRGRAERRASIPAPGVRRATLAISAALLLCATGARATEPALPSNAYEFYEAAAQGDTMTVRGLLEETPSLATLKYKHDVTALHAAALADEPATVEMLVRRGAFVDARGGQQRVTPLFLAVLKGHARVAEALIARRADVNATGSLPGEEGADDVRPLHLAAMNGRADIAELLIQHGAVLAPKTSNGDTPADYAHRNLSTAVSMMLEVYRTLGLVRGRPIATLIRAVNDTDSVAVVRALERQPALANVELEAGWTPLHLAASIGNQAVCDALLSHHADPRARESVTNWTPALRASDSGHAALCEYLRRLETAPTVPGPTTRTSPPR